MRNNPRQLMFVVCYLFCLTACDTDPKNQKSAQNSPSISVHPGKDLHDTYCGSCHVLPHPGDLSKKTWQNQILIRMGAYMGIYFDNVKYHDAVPEKWLEPGEGRDRVMAANIYPEKPVVSRQDWEKIRDYVLSSAPEVTYGPPGMLPITKDLRGFKTTIIQPDTALQPFITSIAIDEDQQQLYAGFFQQSLVQMDKKGNIISRIPDVYGPVQIQSEKGQISVTDIGSIGGSDSPKGNFQSASSFSKLKSRKYDVDMNRLMRPVHSTWADLDQDGDEDLLLCEFGYHLGELAWHENVGKGKAMLRHTLYPDDGAVSAGVYDFNGDSLPDIIALMANADERLDIYINLGNGQFKKKQVFRFNPTYGMAAMEIVDFDEDGRMDFILSNGDNGDYPPILKANHGIRIYLNKGDFNFVESKFLGMNGAYGTRTRDFDQDGDLDIAAVSFYPDYNNRADEAFILFNQINSMEFEAHTFPEVGLARWMVMDAGDIDGDGDEDIVLGGFNVKSGDASKETYDSWMENWVPMVLLENLLR